MAHNFSFKTEVTKEEGCYFLNPILGWEVGTCFSWTISPDDDGSLNLHYYIRKSDGKIFGGSFNRHQVANKEGFNEWRSRVIDTAVQQFNYKGNVDNVFGPPSFNELLPMYIAGKSPVTAYMASMGLLETDFDDE